MAWKTGIKRTKGDEVVIEEWGDRGKTTRQQMEEKYVSEYAPALWVIKKEVWEDCEDKITHYDSGGNIISEDRKQQLISAHREAKRAEQAELARRHEESERREAAAKRAQMEAVIVGIFEGIAVCAKKEEIEEDAKEVVSILLNVQANIQKSQDKLKKLNEAKDKIHKAQITMQELKSAIQGVKSKRPSEALKELDNKLNNLKKEIETEIRHTQLSANVAKLKTASKTAATDDKSLAKRVMEAVGFEAAAVKLRDEASVKGISCQQKIDKLVKAIQKYDAAIKLNTEKKVDYEKARSRLFAEKKNAELFRGDELHNEAIKLNNAANSLNGEKQIQKRSEAIQKYDQAIELNTQYKETYQKKKQVIVNTKKKNAEALALSLSKAMEFEASAAKLRDEASVKGISCQQKIDKLVEAHGEYNKAISLNIVVPFV